MSFWILISTMALSLVPNAVQGASTPLSCPQSMELSLNPAQKAYEFNQKSKTMTCAFVDLSGEGSVSGSRRLVVRNHVIGSEVASKTLHQSRRATIKFEIRNIQSSTTFSCELWDENDLVICRALAQVSVFINSPVSCSSNKDCWGYGRNLLCDEKGTRRCMCAMKTARAMESPLCIEVVVEEKCNQLSCEENEADCVCMRDDALVLKQTRYTPYSRMNAISTNDIVTVFDGNQTERFLPWKRDECLRCLRVSNGLQNLQIGLFLVGLVLAFTAVTLMAIVIRKMWLYYRIPPDLLEASRDLERETIEREAELMAQRDKPPSYVEVMEYDLRISGYPPPAYEESASPVRGSGNQRRGLTREIATIYGNDDLNGRAAAQTRSTRHSFLSPLHRIAQCYRNGSPIRSPLRAGSSNSNDQPPNSSPPRY
ncbi:uncharacterized protein LOC100898775 [Galendromus occidentalis]|uniref:Uncharacterized protein LOC100898775 n=1 Tax=Galendromus occidentalis TaxID=34638 RepID=A0AAJ6QNB0_9ACAR|nr:uncharacterized protein LOC100898775 [Galendromus occidentalis]